MKVKVLNNKYIVGSYVFNKNELSLIMDTVPLLPSGIVSLYYENNLTTQSTGKTSQVIEGANEELDWMVQNVNYLIQETNKLRGIAPEEEELTLPDVLANKRYEVEEGGVTLNGIAIQTKRSSRADILGARIEAMADGNYTLEWKADSGFITLDAPTLILISSVVSAHVRQCFIIENQVLQLIEDDTLTTVEGVEDKFDELYATWLAALEASLQP